MNKGTTVKGIFIAIIGFAIMMGSLEGEVAMLEFVNSFGFSAIEGVGIGATIGFIGVIITLAGFLRSSS